jgi:hypothetical protein
MKLRVAVLGVVAAALLAGPARACPLPSAYPGDSAAQADVAGWMANGAMQAGLPGELPVMGALVASGLKNLSGGDLDEVGYFLMRVSIWDRPPYAGFPDHPQLQLQWFVDQALAVRGQYLAQGRPDPVGVESGWGEWIADVLRPAAQYRYRYQLRLADARALIGPACTAGASPPAGPGPGPSGGTPPDTTAPVARLGGPLSQRPLRRGALLVDVTCPAEACTAAAAATLRVPGRARALRLRSKTTALGQGQTLTLRLPLSSAARAAVRRALCAHRPLRARLVVTVTDPVGNAATAARTVRLRL